MGSKISLFSLVFLIVAAIDSIRNLPTTAIFGSSLIFFVLFSAIVFLIPISLVAAEFSSRFTDHGGIFYWVRHAFGEKIALFAIWLQWINTMVWYPTILSFIAGTAAYLIDPDLAQNKSFIIFTSLLVFWGLTLINLKGIHVSARINSFCGLVGLMIPMTFLIVLGLIWVLVGNPVQIEFNFQTLLPSFEERQHWVSLVAIMASFLGMELSGVHVTDISNPKKNFPKALAWAVFILLTTMVLGSLSIAMVIPMEEIRLIDGIMQTFTQFFAAFHIPWMAPILTVLIIIGSVGGMINWLVSPAKGLLQAAEHGFLPPFFTKKNREGVPARLLFVQAVLVTCFCLLINFMPSINSFYWFLMALSTELYMIMYILLFAAAFKLGRPREAFSYQIPKGLRRLTCLLGLFGCCLTIFVGYLLPDGIEVGGASRYALMVAFGNVILISPVFLLLFYKRKNTIN